MIADYDKKKIENYKVIEDGIPFDEKKISYVQNHPDAIIYNHPLWFECLEAETQKKVITLWCYDSEGNIKGVLPLQETGGVPFGFGSFAGVRRLSSLPRTPLGGMLLSDEKAGHYLLSHLISKMNSNENKYLQLKETNPELYECFPQLKKIKWRKTYLYEFPSSKKEIRFGNSRNNSRIKWSVKKALKKGLRVREAESIEDFKTWYNLYVETCRWHFVPPRSLKFFLALREYLQEKKMMKLLLAEINENGRKIIIDGSLFLMFNKTIFYAFNGRMKEYFKYRPNDLIQWKVIYDSFDQGYSYYDLGEVSDGNEGLADFKSKWSNRTKQIYHFYFPSLPAGDKNFYNGSIGTLTKNIWRYIPLELTRVIGNKINQYL